MKKETLILISASVFLVLIMAGFAYWLSGRPSYTNLPEIQGVAVEPDFYDLEEVPLEGGIVTKYYEVTNETEQTLRLRKISTSCMCTLAKLKAGDRETRFYGMEGHGDINAPLNLEISPGETALVTVDFDPAAHGPAGVGYFERIVWLTFSDPGGVKELWFKGTVVN